MNWQLLRLADGTVETPTTHVYQILFACLSASAAAESFPAIPFPTTIDTFVNATVYKPANNRSSPSYSRTETLPGDVILAAWTEFESVNSSLPIYRSKDDGKQGVIGAAANLRFQEGDWYSLIYCTWKRILAKKEKGPCCCHFMLPTTRARTSRSTYRRIKDRRSSL